MSINEFQAVYLIELPLNLKPIWRSARQFMYIDCTPNILSRANTFYSFTSNSNAHINVLLYLLLNFNRFALMHCCTSEANFFYISAACPSHAIASLDALALCDGDY